MYIEHCKAESPTRNIGMLLPIGVYKNRKILDLLEGDLVEFYEEEKGIVISVCEISIYSDFCKALSMQLYNAPIDVVIKEMKRNWYSEMNEDEVIYLVVKKDG